ncbi:glycosyltransferase family 2 protein [Aestuariivivens sediminis]|uniref:glycosyltransferase family 2 protein n=1 Tax=Aestuariivivens sediminis TaxID=2913557 RepID=UPI001F59A6E1|nr:glycosyltransferase family 2 protein [Aestuariivivens sediminis]
MNPLVSICIPTYNGEAYLNEALNSAIAQTYTNLEIVISDDGSHDGTLKIVESYKQKTNIPIRVYNHRSQGIGANWNNCVKQAKGDFIKFLFQDDVLHPECVFRMVDMAQQYPKVSMVYCRRSFLLEGNREQYQDYMDYYGHLHHYWQDIKVRQGVLLGKAYLTDKAFLNSPKNKIGEPSCVLFKTSCFIKIGGFSEVLKQTLDCEFWYRLMKLGDVGFIDDALAKFRLHEQQASHLNKVQGINETSLLYYHYYKHLFWQLHTKSRWKLLKLYHPVVKTLVGIKRFLNV